MNVLERLVDWVYEKPNSTTKPADMLNLTITTTPFEPEKKTMGYKPPGAWTRKPEFEFATIQDMEQVKAHVLDRHPMTVCSMFSEVYIKYFGADEFEVLKASIKGGKFNFVMHYNPDWIQGEKTQIPIPPKVEPVLKEGYVWQDNPFGGKRQVPAGQAYAKVTVVDLTDEALHKIAEHVYEMMKAALNSAASKPL